MALSLERVASLAREEASRTGREMFTGAFNVFRVLADLSHLLSFFLLFIKMFRSRSVEGLSRRTQEIFLLVFVCRYLDIFFVHHISFLTVYNTIMKVFFILSSAVIVASFHRIPWKATYNDKEDSFRHWLFLVLPCALLGLAFPASYDVMEVLYAFSIFLEAVASAFVHLTSLFKFTDYKR